MHTKMWAKVFIGVALGFALYYMLGLAGVL